MSCQIRIEKKKDFSPMKNFFVKSRPITKKSNKFIFQHGTKRTIYRMGRKSCDTWLDPEKFQDRKEYTNPKDPSD